MTPDAVIAAGNTLGEGIQWHAKSGLWWTDIQQSIILHLPNGADVIERFPMPERVGSFALVEGDESGLVCAFETGFGFYSCATGRLEWIARLERQNSGRRFNDGRVDRQGRFWSGTMVEDETLASRDSAELYCLDGGHVSPRYRQIGISNGLAWSPDGRTMYFADSSARNIFAFDFDTASGDICNQRLFATTPAGTYPDGATVDAAGCLWSAQWGSSRVVRYTPDGNIDRGIELPVSQPTCIAFGGEALDLLFITTARDGLSKEVLAMEPLAGDVLVYRAGVTGLAEEVFQPAHRGDI